MAFHLGYVADSDEEGWRTVMRNAALPCRSCRLVELVLFGNAFNASDRRNKLNTCHVSF